MNHNTAIDLPRTERYLRLDGGSPKQPGLYLYLPTMPRPFHRLMMRLLFGWRVTDRVEDQVEGNGPTK